MSLFTARPDRHAQALDLLSRRQKLLAGNVANADTPGFKARDFDFAQTLAQVQFGVRVLAALRKPPPGGRRGASGPPPSSPRPVRARRPAQCTTASRVTRSTGSCRGCKSSSRCADREQARRSMAKLSARGRRSEGPPPAARLKHSP